jgi:uncharacterized protein (DUF486 family)
MKGFWYILFGAVCAICAGLLWWWQERQDQLINGWVILSIFLMLFGGFNILLGIDFYVRSQRSAYSPSKGKASFLDWVFIISLIFLGSISYTLAAYYHLKLHNWSFLTAFAIALPLILIEYQFSMRGNHGAKTILGLNIVQITLMTMAFYFINSWLLNYFVIKQPVVWWREVLAFLCIALAFILTTTTSPR